MTINGRHKHRGRIYRYILRRCADQPVRAFF
jgi:hypothetical protein